MIEISQSLIKKFFYKGEKRDYCPYQIYCEAIAKTHSRETLSMTAGNYFESLCLGANVDGSLTEDMPRKKLTAKQIIQGKTIGDKTIDQKRIEQQHMVFEKLKAQYQIQVHKDINTQVKIVKEFSRDDNVLLVGTADIFPTTILLPERGLRLAVIDLKLTAQFTDFGEYCWATPHAIDPIQGLFYNELIRDIDIELNRKYNADSRLHELFTDNIKKQLSEVDPLFFFWIFNYKTNDLTNKFIEVRYDRLGQLDLFESIRRTLEEINKNEREGWDTTNPSYERCSMCAVLDCPARVMFKDKKSKDEQQFEII